LVNSVYFTLEIGKIRKGKAGSGAVVESAPKWTIARASVSDRVGNRSQVSSEWKHLHPIGRPPSNRRHGRVNKHRQASTNIEIFYKHARSCNPLKETSAVTNRNQHTERRNHDLL